MNRWNTTWQNTFWNREISHHANNNPVISELPSMEKTVSLGQYINNTIVLINAAFNLLYYYAINIFFFVSRSGPKRKHLPTAPEQSWDLKATRHSSTKLTLALKDMCAVKSDLFGCISVAEWLLASQSAETLFFCDLVKHGADCLGVASWPMPRSSSHRREPVLQSGALRLGLAVCPFRLGCLHSVVSLLLRMRRCWEGGDRCAAVTLNKLRNIMLPAAPARGGGGRGNKNG